MEQESPEPAQEAVKLPTTSTATGPSPVPPPVPVATHPNRGAFKAPTPARAFQETHRLAPSDPYYGQSPPRLRPLTEVKSIALNGSAAANAAAAALRPAVASLRPPPAIPTAALNEKKRRSVNRRKRGPPVWKKLLWVKQPYPDNYTDTETFLKKLERNPRFSPYEFWSLVAESSVIVQHVCSVAIFASCFVGIFQDRISSYSVVTAGTFFTVLGWALWDYWIWQEEKERVAARMAKDAINKAKAILLPPCTQDETSVSSAGSFEVINKSSNGAREAIKPAQHGLGLSLSTSNLSEGPNDKRPSLTNQFTRSSSGLALESTSHAWPKTPPPILSPQVRPLYPKPTNRFSRRYQNRLKTFKSALLIYFALLGLSPILQSLTKSTSSDSIWALATWLICINIFFFDYGTASAFPTSSYGASALSSSNSSSSGGGGAATFPASLSTNAALMASTVLASRLTSTTDVFSLTLFSIQIFGLFPVFRRHLRHVSRRGHYLLTLALVVAATGGISIILTSQAKDWWGVLGRVIAGEIVGVWSIVIAMGGCTWWLISLQRYKNVVSGPWDPAKPILKGRPRGMTDA